MALTTPVQKPERSSISMRTMEHSVYLVKQPGVLLFDVKQAVIHENGILGLAQGADRPVLVELVAAANVFEDGFKRGRLPFGHQFVVTALRPDGCIGHDKDFEVGVRKDHCT